PLRLDPAAFFHAMQRGVKRAVDHVEASVGSLADEPRHGVAMHPAPRQGAKDEHVERALKQVELGGHGGRYTQYLRESRGLWGETRSRGITLPLDTSAGLKPPGSVLRSELEPEARGTHCSPHRFEILAGSARPGWRPAFGGARREERVGIGVLTPGILQPRASDLGSLTRPRS